ncbi:hypothetical protein GQ457_05G005050 [Hibiscus cannabinus]
MVRSLNDYEIVAEVLPEGFLDRTSKIDRIIGWAPQVVILSHSTIGGFMSHCGWNSTLESIWFRVPIVAWPLYAEQQLNALTLVKELGLTVEIKMDNKIDEGKVEIIKAEKIERGIRWLMRHESDVRRRMKKISDKSRKALLDGGSSHSIDEIQLHHKAELVFIPTPAMGHLVSAVQLAKLLVHLSSNLSITVLTVKPLHDAKVSAYIDSLTATTTTGRVKFISLSQCHPDVDVFKFFSNLVQTLRPLVKKVVTDIVEHSNSVPDSPRLVGFVLDTLLTSLVDLANEFGVPNYAFFTSGAGFLGFLFYTQALHDEQKIEFGELKDTDTVFTIPSEVKGIMINTFSELESHAVGSLCNGKLQIPPIYPVGPLLNLEGSRNLHQNYDSIMQWLDEQPSSSVVYLCFGSMGSFGVDQVKEITYALEQSRHRFLWSLRRPPEQGKDVMIHSLNDYENVAEVLPEGFLDRTIEIGKIIGWAPQTVILSHPAIGGFISHCGWNSTLESIWFGVPMAAWPLYAEQQLNALTLIKELGLAVEIKMDYKVDGDEIEIIKAEKIEKGIKWLMGRESDVRHRMKKINDKCKNVLIDGGSSHTMLCRFIDDITNNMT